MTAPDERVRAIVALRELAVGIVEGQFRAGEAEARERARHALRHAPGSADLYLAFRQEPEEHARAAYALIPTTSPPRVRTRADSFRADLHSRWAPMAADAGHLLLRVPCSPLYEVLIAVGCVTPGCGGIRYLGLRLNSAGAFVSWQPKQGDPGWSCANQHGESCVDLDSQAPGCGARFVLNDLDGWGAFLTELEAEKRAIRRMSGGDGGAKC